MRALVAMGLAGLVALGCEEQKPAPSASAVTPPSQVAPTGQVATTSQIATTSQVPTEEDFEERAESTITPANADQELSKLEKEIGQ